jgi:hypothetical protein
VLGSVRWPDVQGRDNQQGQGDRSEQGARASQHDVARV